MTTFQGYLTVSEFRTETTAPGPLVDDCERTHHGYLAAKIRRRSGRINSQLELRYATPFAAPYPDTVVEWVTKLVTLDLYEKVGYQVSAEANAYVVDRAKEALAEVQLAADAQNGLYNLPLRADTNASGVSRGGPRSYSEQSPYVGFDRQAATARGEDAAGRGTGG